MANYSSENELVIRLKRSDEKAFDILYRKYFYAVYSNSLKLTKDKSHAEDIVQEVFIKLWEKRSELHETAGVGSWLFTVCYNKSVDKLRMQVRRKRVVPVEILEKVAEPEAGNIEDDNNLKILNQALLYLSPQQRKVFDLCKLQGKTYEEAARQLHISKHTVKEYLASAMQLVKDSVINHPDITISTLIMLQVISSTFF